MPNQYLPTTIALFTLTLAGITPARAQQQTRPTPAPIDVRLIADEPRAVLDLLQANQRQATTPGLWDRLFASEGYVALKRREAAMGREFSDADFRAFVLSDTLAARTGDLVSALGRLERLDVSQPAARAMAYLPAGTPLKSRLFLEIKPRTNSFVFDLDGTRAIFLYVDPAESAAQVSNTMSHELHHVGLSTACTAPEDTTLPPPVREARNWATAFGEGVAMLAAAGGPDIHPHATGDSATRARWDRDVANFSSDLERVQAFFTAVLEGRLTGDSLQEAGMSFFGVQGPWYTVGWKMAVTIELMLGRDRLIAVLCDPVALLAEYNRAAAEWRQRRGEGLATWDEGVIGKLRSQRTH